MGEIERVQQRWTEALVWEFDIRAIAGEYSLEDKRPLDRK